MEGNKGLKWPESRAEIYGRTAMDAVVDGLRTTLTGGVGLSVGGEREAGWASAGLRLRAGEEKMGRRWAGLHARARTMPGWLGLGWAGSA